MEFHGVKPSKMGKELKNTMKKTPGTSFQNSMVDLCNSFVKKLNEIIENSYIYNK
jgi:hypothetical protein